MTRTTKILGMSLAAAALLSAAGWIAYGRGSNHPGETRYGRYIVTRHKPPAAEPANLDAQPKDMLIQMTYLDGGVVPGAYYTECSWLLKAYPDRVWVKEHTHDFDEVFGFYGSDVANPRSLGGEIELWIGGERHILTESCLVFVPKGTRHCPLILRRIDKPIFMFTTGPAQKYGS